MGLPSIADATHHRSPSPEIEMSNKERRPGGNGAPLVGEGEFEAAEPTASGDDNTALAAKFFEL